jgi:hypothetical protein
MIKNQGPKLSFSISFVIALLFHLVVLFFVKKNEIDPHSLSAAYKGLNPIKLDNIKMINREELEQLKKVGIKNGQKKDFFQPDMQKMPKLTTKTSGLSLSNLAPNLPTPQMTKKPNENKSDFKNPNIKNQQLRHQTTEENSLPTLQIQTQEGSGNIYFNPKKEKIIRRDHDQDNLKQEAYNNNSSTFSSPIAQKMSNFEIRYERPEGVSEDELNSDEKAFYSFFKRSYANYLSKLYATYDKAVIERPGLEKDFNSKHVLLARIDYDEKGNILLIKIIKSSDSDNIHYFFEETLKQLNLPNPPKSFIKNKKQFSTFYQIQIN